MIDLRKMIAALQQQSPRRLAIIPHNNPDPDAIASALGLKFMIEGLTPSRATILYDGIISRRNNREMVRVLRIPVTRLQDPPPWTDYDLFCLVDCQPGMGNNPLPESIRPFLVVDHHPSSRASKNAQFRDVRSDVGSTAAIVCEYLTTLDLFPPGDLATALYYGIKTDTDGLSRDVTQLDKDMFHQLFPVIDPEKLARIEKPDLPRSYYHDIGDAVLSARIYGSVVVTDLGRVWSPEMPSEMADFLLRMEGICTTWVYGLYEDRIYFSLRTSRQGLNLGDVAMLLVDGFGTAGGHSWAAGGLFPFTPENVTTVRRRFFDLFTLDEASYSRILDKQDPPLDEREDEPDCGLGRHRAAGG